MRRIESLGLALILGLAAAAPARADEGDKLYNKGIDAMQAGRYAEAVKDFRDSLRRKPQKIETYDELVEASIRDNQPQEALDAIGAVRLRKTERAKAFVLAGAAYERRNRDADAAVAYQDAIREDPNNVQAHINLGAALARMGRMDEAREHFQHAAQLSPNNARAHYNLGAALTRAGQYDEAVHHFEEAARLDTHNELNGMAQFGLATAYAHMPGRQADAVAAYRQALATNPNLVEAHYGLAAALAQSGQYQEAEGEMREVVRQRSDYPGAQANLGAIYMQLHEPRRAAAAYRRALQNHPNDANLHFGLASAYIGMRDAAGARQEYETLRRLDPSMAQQLVQPLGLDAASSQNMTTTPPRGPRRRRNP